MSAIDDIKTYILAHYSDDDPAYVARIMPQIEAEAQELYDVVAAELAEKIRSAQFGPEGCMWDWWDAATIPDQCAKVIDPEATP